MFLHVQAHKLSKIALKFCLNMDRILTVHGSDDPIVSVDDAKEFDRFISNHKLQILAGANHRFTEHEENLASLVIDFLEDEVQL